MLGAETVLDILESNFQSIRSHLGPQWMEFGHKGGTLADRFRAIASEEDPRTAERALESAVNKLLKICWEYEYVADLLDQAEGASWGPRAENGGIMRPPSPGNGPEFSPKEIANRYYDLLAKLREGADQVKEDTNDRRTHT
jgi:hypothetical protein